MFVLLKKFIENNYSDEMWFTLAKEAGIHQPSYDPHKSYDAEEMFSIIAEASKKTGISESDLKEKFGEYLVPDLMIAYGAYVNPEWKTFEVLEYTEHVMHKAVRKEESSANPPVLNISRVHDQLLIIDYYSKRKLGSLAVGIINGIARFYNETDIVNVIPMSNPNDERVQIRVEFKKP
ncbi:MAG TPA: heme NO-binding domain-containing protein [Bacteroidia bacterium]|jgi:hypothetical protein